MLNQKTLVTGCKSVSTNHIVSRNYTIFLVSWLPSSNPFVFLNLNFFFIFSWRFGSWIHLRYLPTIFVYDDMPLSDHNSIRFIPETICFQCIIQSMCLHIISFMQSEYTCNLHLRHNQCFLISVLIAISNTVLLTLADILIPFLVPSPLTHNFLEPALLKTGIVECAV